jgi:hypothetical protein
LWLYTKWYKDNLLDYKEVIAKLYALEITALALTQQIREYRQLLVESLDEPKGDVLD